MSVIMIELLIAGDDLVNDRRFGGVACAFKSVSKVVKCTHDFTVVWFPGIDRTGNEALGFADSFSIGSIHTAVGISCFRV